MAIRQVMLNRQWPPSRLPPPSLLRITTISKSSDVMTNRIVSAICTSNASSKDVKTNEWTLLASSDADACLRPPTLLAWTVLISTATAASFLASTPSSSVVGNASMGRYGHSYGSTHFPCAVAAVGRSSKPLWRNGQAKSYKTSAYCESHSEQSQHQQHQQQLHHGLSSIPSHAN